VYIYAVFPTTYAPDVVVAKPHGSTAFCSSIRRDKEGRMMEASAAIENGGRVILSDTHNLQDVPYRQFLVRAYLSHKIALWPVFEGVATVSGKIRWAIGCNL